MLFLLGVTFVFFEPIFRGDTFSTVPGHQTAVYPWASLPHSLFDVYPQSDQADLNFPWQTFVSDTVRTGAFPFWEPHSYGGGYPFFANGQSGVLYPPRLLTAFFVGAGWAHDLFSMLHVLLAGIAMYALAREFRVGLAGSLLAGVSWMFSGFNMAWLHLEVVAPMSVFLPLVLLCVHRAFRSGSWTSAVVAGFALGGALISGHLILLGLVYLVGMSYAASLATRRALAHFFAGASERCVPEILRLAAVGGTSLGLAAVVLVPTGLLLADSQRDRFSYGELTRSFLAPASTFLHSLTPPPLPITEGHMHEMTFVGTITAVLAVGGLIRRRPGVWLGRTLLLASFFIAVGTPATWFVYHIVPGFNVFRPYSRLVVFWSFALSLLGAFGLDALTSRSAAWRASSPTGRILVIGLSVAAVGATTVQLISYGRNVNPPFVKRTRASAYPATPLIKAVQAEVRRPGQWPGRILPVRAVGPDNAQPPPMLFAGEPLVFGLDSTGGYDSAIPRRVTALMRVLQGEDPEAVLSSGLPSAYAPTFLSTNTRFDLATRLGVTTIVTTPGPRIPDGLALAVGSPPTATVYDGPDGRVLRVLGATAVPRVVYTDEVVRSDQEALRRFIDAEFDFEHSVVLEEPELLRTGYKRLTSVGLGKVDSATRGVNTSSIRVTTNSPAWLVFPTSWSPGWSATVNGKSVPIIRANYTKQALRVPPGSSIVRLRYRPAGLMTGGAISSVTLLGCLTIPLSAFARRRRGANPTPRGARRPTRK